MEHFGDALVNHDNPSMSKAKDKVEPVFWVDTFIKNSLALFQKYILPLILMRILYFSQNMCKIIRKFRRGERERERGK